NWTTFGLLAVFCIFAPLGLWRGNVDHLRPLFADPGPTGPLLSIFAVLPIVPYFLMGFETIPKCSEEAASDFKPGHFNAVMLLALGVATFFYITVIAVVALLVPWEELCQTKGTSAPPGAVAFERAFGWPWLVQLIMFGAVLSLLKVFNGNFLA